MHRVGFARERGVHDVRDRHHPRAATLGLARGHDGVDRLAALGDADDQRADLDDRVAVAVLARDVDLDADARPALDGVLGHQRRVVRGAGRDQHDRFTARSSSSLMRSSSKVIVRRADAGRAACAKARRAAR